MYRASRSRMFAPVLPLEVDALLDHQGGLEKYHRDDEHREAVVEHFRVNLERAIRLSRAADVPLLLLLPPTNLRDCPPFKSECSPGLSEELLRQLTDSLDLAAKYLAAEPDESVEYLQKAVEIDPRFAFAWYHLGHAYLAAHRIDDAKAAFIRARDEDVCPCGWTSDLESVTYEVVAQQSCELIDLSRLLAQHSNDGILGDDFLRRPHSSVV